jgi:hypothetical protein
MAESVTGPTDIVIGNATILPMGGGATIENGMRRSAATASPSSDLQTASMSQRAKDASMQKVPS